MHDRDRKTLMYPVALTAAILTITPITQANADLVALGKTLFFDATLSEPSGQSCASCHAPIQQF